MEIAANTTPDHFVLLGQLMKFSGPIITSILAGLIAFFVASFKTKFELNKERVNRKLDVSYKYAELNTKDPTAANLFLASFTKDTAIGFLFLDDNNTREKIWVRNDSNILFGRQKYCDVIFEDNFISREHCVIHSQDNKTFLIPLNPTNSIKIGFRKIKKKQELKNGDKIKLHEDYPYNYIFFKF